MEKNDLGSKELTVTVKEVAETLVATKIAVDSSKGLPPVAADVAIEVVMSIFHDFTDVILEYINQRQKSEAFKEAIKRNASRN